MSSQNVEALVVSRREGLFKYLTIGGQRLLRPGITAIARLVDLVAFRVDVRRWTSLTDF